MKALILKDFYVLWRQFRYFLALLLIFSVIPKSFSATFIVIYAGMLPYSAMAYDERSKWEQLAAMLPYSNRDIVLGKYVFGWLCTLAAAVLSLGLQALASSLWSALLSPGFRVTALAVCSACCILALTLPMMFRFGVEKGRMVMFLMIFLVCGSAGILNAMVEAADHSGLVFPVLVMAGLPAVALVLTAVSIPLSLRFYLARQQ